MEGEVFARARSYDPQSEIGRRIDQFLKRTEKITPNVKLVGSRNYPEWKLSVLMCAERAGAADILIEKESECPSEDPDEILFWKEQDHWLYYFIWDSLSSEQKGAFTRPEDRSAYVLWHRLGASYGLSPELLVPDTLPELGNRPRTGSVGDLESSRSVRKAMAKLDKWACYRAERFSSGSKLS